MSSALAIELSEAGSDPERLDELTTRLREELLNLDVEDVEKVSAGDAPAPDGSRAIELAAIGALLVTAAAIGPSDHQVVINTIREWLKRDPEPTREVEITMGDRIDRADGGFECAAGSGWSPSSSARAAADGAVPAAARRLFRRWPWMAGRRLALIVATDQYRDPGLKKLRAPGTDARRSRRPWATRSGASSRSRSSATRRARRSRSGSSRSCRAGSPTT